MKKIIYLSSIVIFSNSILAECNPTGSYEFFIGDVPGGSFRSSCKDNLGGHGFWEGYSFCSFCNDNRGIRGKTCFDMTGRPDAKKVCLRNINGQLKEE